VFKVKKIIAISEEESQYIILFLQQFIESDLDPSHHQMITISVIIIGVASNKDNKVIFFLSKAM
jgi:hypothetical protein